MGFVQIIEFRTKDLDAVRKMDDEWWAATEGKRTLRRGTVAVDRNDPERCFVIAEFDSYEAAMANSELPETQAFAQRQRELADGPATFYDLDVIEVREG